MGPRTANRGFDYAPVIAADNVLRQGVGGGVCQYATTLFNAVFFAGLPVVERHAHSLYISHYPTGRDATVAWGALDFKFRNDTGKSIMIRSWIDGGALTVALVGKTGRDGGRTRRARSTTSASRRTASPIPRVVYDSDLGPGVIRWERGHRRAERARGADGQGRVGQGAVPRHVRVALRADGLDQARRAVTRSGRRGRAPAPPGPPPHPVLAMTCLQTTLSVSNTP